MHELPMYVVDAFTDKRFQGNPAAVCLLSSTLGDDIRHKIAAEMNLSETAFLERLSDRYGRSCFSKRRSRHFTGQPWQALCAAKQAI